MKKAERKLPPKKVSWQHIYIDDDIDTGARQFFVKNKKDNRSSLSCLALRRFLTEEGFIARKTKPASKSN